MNGRIRVAVLYGGTSAEHEVSVVSARSVLQAIDRERYDVVPIAITKSGTWLLPGRTPDQLEAVQGTLPAVAEDEGLVVQPRPGGALEGADHGAPIDVVFPVLHGPGGEDGTVQGMLDLLGIPYVGAGVAASAVGMDKSLQKPIFRNAGIPVTPWIDIRFEEFSDDVTLAVTAARDFVGLPCFVKPASLGSSVGVAKCTSAGELLIGLSAAFAHDNVVLVEKAVAGRELECAVLGNEHPQASVVGEVIPVNEFYDYEAKYLVEGSKLVIPAEIPEGIAKEIQGYAIQAFQAIRCEGMARVDFFLDDQDRVLLNEINTIPGFTPISMYPKLWEASGVSYTELIDRLIQLALERHRTQASRRTEQP